MLICILSYLRFYKLAVTLKHQNFGSWKVLSSKKSIPAMVKFFEALIKQNVDKMIKSSTFMFFNPLSTQKLS